MTRRKLKIGPVPKLVSSLETEKGSSANGQELAAQAGCHAGDSFRGKRRAAAGPAGAAGGACLVTVGGPPRRRAGLLPEALSVH